MKARLEGIAVRIEPLFSKLSTFSLVLLMLLIFVVNIRIS